MSHIPPLATHKDGCQSPVDVSGWTREPSFEVVKPWTDVPVTEPSSRPITLAARTHQPTNPPFTSLYLSIYLFLTITFFTLRLLLTALLSQLARHSCRRRCGAARIDPLPLTWTCHTPNLSFQSSWAMLCCPRHGFWSYFARTARREFSMSGNRIGNTNGIPWVNLSAFSPGWNTQIQCLWFIPIRYTA